MRVRMQRSGAALVEGELDHHRFVGMQYDAASPPKAFVSG